MVGIVGADREQRAEENLRWLMLRVKLFALIRVDKDGTWGPLGSSRELLARFGFAQAMAAGILGLLRGHPPERVPAVIHASPPGTIRSGRINRNITKVHVSPSWAYEIAQLHRMGDSFRVHDN